MLEFTYKYIGVATFLLFACTALLIILSYSHYMWYVLVIPCVLVCNILIKRDNKIYFDEEKIVIEKLYKKDVFCLEDIRKFKIYKDPFFYGNTLCICIFLKNRGFRKYYIGTLSASHLSELDKSLNSRL